MIKSSQHLNYLLVFILLSTISFISCKKEEGNSNDALDNPTNGRTSAEFNSNVSYGSMTDQDGNVYKTVTIDTLTWMAENLRTTKYNDGTTIPIVLDDDEWAALQTGAYCNYNNTTGIDTIATYGRLYNWFAVNSGKLAPNGWHVPTIAEWTALTTYLGGVSVAGGKLKETGTIHWLSPNTGATNETGFSGLPGGIRDENGTFIGIGNCGAMWFATVYYGSNAWLQIMRYGDNDAYLEGGCDMKAGLSVRCVRD